MYHNRWNTVRHAFSRSRHWGMVLDTTCMQNAGSSPYGGAKLFRTVQQAAMEYSEHVDWEDEFFEISIHRYAGKRRSYITQISGLTSTNL